VALERVCYLEYAGCSNWDRKSLPSAAVDHSDTPGEIGRHSHWTGDAEPRHPFPRPMHHLRPAFALAIALFTAGTALAQPPSHFADCAQLTGRSATILFPTSAILTIDGVNLQPGDEIAAVTPAGKCAGSMVYSGGSLALPIWENDPFTEALDGFVAGEALALQVFQRATGKVVQAAGTGPLVSYDPAYSSSGEFTPEAVVVVTAVTFATGAGAEGVLPLVFGLAPAYPNPFSSRTTLSYSLPASARVTLEVFDLLGRRVGTLIDEPQSPGRYEVPFDVTDLGEHLADGVYIGRLTADDRSATVRMTLIR
jgi:hypothetical protein